MWLLVGLMSCGHAGRPHDLWIDIVSEDPDGSKVTMHLPANGLLEHEESVTIDTPNGTIDLKRTAAEFRMTPGVQSRSWDVDDVRVTLAEVRARVGTPATRVRIGAKGAKGFGLSVTLPLDDARCAEKLGEHLSVDEVDVPWGPELCHQLSRGAPTTLLSIEGEQGGGMTIATE